MGILLKTKLQIERENRDMAIYSEYMSMMSQEGQSATEVAKYLMEKHNLHSLSSIYVVKRRVEQRLKKK